MRTKRPIMKPGRAYLLLQRRTNDLELQYCSPCYPEKGATFWVTLFSTSGFGLPHVSLQSAAEVVLHLYRCRLRPPLVSLQ